MLLLNKAQGGAKSFFSKIHAKSNLFSCQAPAYPSSNSFSDRQGTKICYAEFFFLRRLTLFGSLQNIMISASQKSLSELRYFKIVIHSTGSKKFPSTLASRDGVSKHSAKQTRQEQRAGTGSLPASSRFSWPGRRRWCPRWSRRSRTGRECPLWSARSGKKSSLLADESK